MKQHALQKAILVQALPWATMTAGTVLAQPVFQPPLAIPAAKTPLAQHGWLNALGLAGKRLVTAGVRGHILYSDDEGKSWTLAQVPVSSDLLALSFPSAKQGWA